jgi:predicted DNA-binding protein
MLQRPIHVVVRLNADEHQRLKRYAQKTGYSQATYLRALLYKNVPKEKPDDRFFEAMRQLSAIGNSMNQIARKANAIGLLDAPYYKQQAELLQRFELDIYERFMSPSRTP